MVQLSFLSSRSHLIFRELSPYTNCCQTSPQHIASPRHFAPSHPFTNCDPTAPKHFPRTRTKPTAQRRPLISVVYPVSPRSSIYRQKQQKHSPHTQTHSPSSPDMAICIGRCLSKSGFMEQGFNFAFALFFFSPGLFSENFHLLPPSSSF